MGGLSGMVKEDIIDKGSFFEIIVKVIVRSLKKVDEIIFVLFIWKRKVLELSVKVINEMKSLKKVEVFISEVNEFIFIIRFIWKLFDGKK